MLRAKNIIIILIGVFFFITKSYTQTGINTLEPKATLDIAAKSPSGQNTHTDGILIPRIDRERAQFMSGAKNSTLIYINNASTGTQTGKAEHIDSEDFYYWKANIVGGIDQGKWIKLIPSNTPPSFFYMPSLVLPTSELDSRIINTNNTNYTYDSSTKIFAVNLYAIFSNQFSTPIAKSNTDAKLTSFVLPTATQYDYFVTYADTAVFEQIALDANGILTYKVKENSIIRNGSFMNIVLKLN
ncbi:MAG: hypothetical protein ACTJGD_06385 [Mesonia hippocampi]|uniref:hypothetical protein n=1 Tax=Mesonia hippocampi TaxID=1628250 RepID=UPI003F9AB545